MSDTNLNPVDWCTFYLPFPSIFEGMRDAHMINDNECAISSIENPTHKATFIYRDNLVEVLTDNKYFKKGTISKFMLLSGIKFKYNYHQTISFIQYELMKEPIPYILVGCDYFKIIRKPNRYGGYQTYLKSWKIEVIKRKHSAYLIGQIPSFDDFIIKPDNKNYQPVIENCYNLYSKFEHTPKEGDIKTSLHFMNHIFGEQLDLGFKYLKILYEKPEQALPILTLASKERDTGKTTFINWIEMIFGSNTSLISPEDLLHNFNSNYAGKNIIPIDETFIEKQSGVEKIKALSTAKSIKVNQKNVAEYNIPFFGKFILCTNKIKDFMRIDDDEIRFWIREIPKIPGKKNVLIEDQLMKEIPALLHYLSSLPPINYDTGSRMVFTKEEIVTKALATVKEESYSGLRKDIEIHVAEFFDTNEGWDEFFATVSDIKDRWFRNGQITPSYISKVLREEMKMKASDSSINYQKFADLGDSIKGRPYKFERKVKIIRPEPIHSEIDPPF